MKKFTSILLIILFVISQISYAFSSEESQLSMPGKNSAQETTVESQKQQTKVFRTNFIYVEHSTPSEPESIGKKIFNALNLTLSVVAIPFFFTGPTNNLASNYALNYPLVKHSGDTISSAVSGKSNPEVPYDTGIIYEAVKTKPLKVVIPKKNECQWIAVEQSDKKLLEFKQKTTGWTSSGNRETENFTFNIIDTGDTTLHLGCINSSGEPLLTFTYKFKIIN